MSFGAGFNTLCHNVGILVALTSGKNLGPYFELTIKAGKRFGLLVGNFLTSLLARTVSRPPALYLTPKSFDKLTMLVTLNNATNQHQLTSPSSL